MNTCSGKFVLRIPIVMHRNLVEIAKKRKISLNCVCVDLLNAGLSKKEASSELHHQLNVISDQLKKFFGEKLQGIVLFGSQATGNATNLSDIDLLIILRSDIVIERAIYKWWDENIKWEGESTLNPHFVNLLSETTEAGGLWLEVATTGKIIYQKGAAVDKIFTELKEHINDGHARKYISNGHSYWVWRKI